ncbi:MAG TPA: PhzF family phenazine biosynthesis protein [Verrucomicrobiae bacterium]
MKYPCYIVDAFTGQLFRGNPAAVCPLTAWLPDNTLQAIAAENNLSETAFTVPRGTEFELRWFTPTVEMDLCGHATLAAAFVLIQEMGCPHAAIHFHTKSGRLTVSRQADLLVLDFPARPAQSCAVPEALIAGLGARPEQVYRARDYLAVFNSAAEVLALQPDFTRLHQLDCLGIIVTAPGTDCDFVSRFFAPRAGLNEDPVTGSAHCTLIPYWAARLQRPQLFARQLSLRGGELSCELAGDRVKLGGKAVLYLRGEIVLHDSATVDIK